MRILVVEDEAELAATLVQALEESGYRADASLGEPALRKALSGAYVALILDLMMPGLNGFDFIKRVRAAKSTVPILVLTARDAVTDRVQTLDLGADDYLVKPFSLEELLARVRSLLRRETVRKSAVIHIADLEIDTIKRAVKRASKEIVLTPKEYEILEVLARREGDVVTRELLQDLVWSLEERYSNLVDAHIRKLRRKIDEAFEPKLIRTVHGFGYTLRASEER